jgi:hypothetical protein
VGNGTLIIQRIYAGPSAVEAAVQGVDLFGRHEPEGTPGFTHVTLQGHAE